PNVQAVDQKLVLDRQVHKDRLLCANVTTQIGYELSAPLGKLFGKMSAIVDHSRAILRQRVPCERESVLQSVLTTEWRTLFAACAFAWHINNSRTIHGQHVKSFCALAA